METIAGDLSYNLEFRSIKDDAWYTARVLLNGGTLTVEFENFPEGFNDEIYRVGDFETFDDVSEFFQKFRPVSFPYDDNECPEILEGVRVCACYKNDGLVRFFDAVVDAVHYKEHLPDKCLCTFLLFWQHGPVEGNITSVPLSDICCIIHGPIDSKVKYFKDLAIEKIKRDLSRTSLASSSSNMPPRKRLAGNKKKPCLPTATRASLPQHKQQDMKSATQFSCRLLGNEEKILLRGDQDEDVGGAKDTGYHHYIVIENMEKDLSPLFITEFIHKQTSIIPQAYVFPSLTSETYARGAIVLDSKPKLKRVYEFISNPNHLIVSSKGRPWVIADDKLRVGIFKMAFGSLCFGSQYNFQNKNLDSELKVVYSGTEEYMRAKPLEHLFMEFHGHLNGLRRTLDVEEKKLLLWSHIM